MNNYLTGIFKNIKYIYMPFTLSSSRAIGNSFADQVGGTTQVAVSNVGIGDTTINVSSTTQYPSSGTIKIGTEYITYSGTTATTFTGCTRGTSFSTATTHDIGDTVNGVFIGTPEKNDNPDYNVFIISDQNAKLTMQLSSNSTVWTSSFNTTINIYSNITKGLSNIKGPLYLRLEYRNTSTNLATIDICTSFGKFNVNVPKNSFPAINIAEGRIQGETNLYIIGKNTDVGLSFEDIWTPGGILQWLSSAETMDIVSTSANDTSAGTGARAVQISGLDNDYNEISEVVVLNGLTDVATTNSYLRVNQVLVIQAGSLGWNDGTITITASTALTIQSQIDPEESVSTCSHYTVPLGKNLYVFRGELNSARDITDPATLEFKGYVRYTDSDPNAPFVLFYERRMGTDVQNEITVDIPIVQKITQKSDLVFRAKSTKTTTYCNIRAYCLLIDTI